MKKKAQLLSHPFMALFALIVIAFLLAFGFKSIQSLLSFSNTIETKNFQTDLTRAVNTLYTEPPGSNRKVTLSVPASISTICFVNLRSDLSSIPVAGIRAEAQAWQDTNDQTYTVFFAATQGQKTPDPLAIKKLQPQASFCTSTHGSITVLLENTGTTVDVTSA